MITSSFPILPDIYDNLDYMDMKPDLFCYEELDEAFYEELEKKAQHQVIIEVEEEEITEDIVDAWIEIILHGKA